MNNKYRILLVEDMITQLESMKANLELEGYKVDGVRFLPNAVEALSKNHYHVAIIDIMLAGGDDDTNRDGVEVIKHINKLNEGTRIIVLSNQPEQQLVSDFYTDYNITKYIHKSKKLATEGISVLFDAVANAISSYKNIHIEWDSLSHSIAYPMSEREFFASCSQKIRFKGGVDTFSRIITKAFKHCVPLLVSNDNSLRFAWNEKDNSFSAQHWSKGQGCAIKSIISANKFPDASIGGKFLFKQEKGGLYVYVVKLDDIEVSSYQAL